MLWFTPKLFCVILPGVPWLIRKAAVRSNPTLVVKQEGNKFDMKLTSMFITKEFKFTVGEDYEEAQQNGKMYKVGSATTVKPVLRDHCHEKPPVLNDH